MSSGFRVQGGGTSPRLSPAERGDAERELKRPEIWRRKFRLRPRGAMPDGVVAGVSSVSSYPAEGGTVEP